MPCTSPVFRLHLEELDALVGHDLVGRVPTLNERFSGAQLFRRAWSLFRQAAPAEDDFENFPGRRYTKDEKGQGRVEQREFLLCPGGDGRVNITAEEYLAAVAEGNVPARIESVRELLRWAESRGCGLSFNHGVREYSGLVGFLHGTRMIYPISCKGNGRLIFPMRFLVIHAPFDERAVRAMLQRRLESVPGIRFLGELEGLPHVQLDELTSPAARQQLLAVLDWLREQLSGG